jgi:hypothetical protein
MANVGTAGMCFSRIRRMVSSLSWVAWSMEATPACAAKSVPGSPMAWTATPCAQAMRLFDGRGQLRLSVLVGCVQHAVNHSFPGLVDLYEVLILPCAAGAMTSTSWSAELA